MQYSISASIYRHIDMYCRPLNVIILLLSRTSKKAVYKIAQINELSDKGLARKWFLIP